jgi:AhpD family alkylhydroperoxidase
MKVRLNYGKAAPGVYDAMDALDQYLQACGLERTLIFLVQLRVSQINGCAYCIDMHWKDLRAAGEDEQRLYSLDAWRECPYYSDRERAALAWADAVTRVADGHVSRRRLRRGARAVQRKRTGGSDARCRHNQRVEPLIHRGETQAGNVLACADHRLMPEMVRSREPQAIRLDQIG